MDIKPQLIFIPSTPRSLSTIFLRIFKNDPNVHIINEGFTLIWIEYFLLNQNKTSFFDDPKVLKLEREIESILNQKKTVIFKDMAWAIKCFFMDVIESWESKFNIKYMYLLRHPKPSWTSYKKLVDEEVETGRFTPEMGKFYESKDYIIKLWELYIVRKGKVIITEDLQEDPPKVFKEAFEFCGLIFRKEVLEYKPLIITGISKEEEAWINWYGECYHLILPF